MSFFHNKFQLSVQAMNRWIEALRQVFRKAGRSAALTRWTGSALSGRLGMACLVVLHSLVVYTLSGFFLVPAVGKAALEGPVSAKLGRAITVERIRFNPLTFDLAVDGFKMLEPGGDKVFVSFDRFEVNLDPTQLVASRVGVDRLLVQKPFVRLARDDSGRLNIADLLPEPEAEEEEAAEAKNVQARTPSDQNTQGRKVRSQGPEAEGDRTRDAQGQAPRPDGSPANAAKNQTKQPAETPAKASIDQTSPSDGPPAKEPTGQASPAGDARAKALAAQAAQSEGSPPGDQSAKAAEDRSSRPETATDQPRPDKSPADTTRSESRTVIFERPGLGFRLHDVMLSDGAVLFEDALTGSRQELTALHFGVKSLTSDEPGLRDLFSSGGVINKSSVQLTVKADPFGPSPEAKIRLSIKDVDLKPYAPYLKTADNLEFHLDQLGVLAGVRFPHLAQGDRSPVVDLDARFDGLQLAVEGRPTFGMESMSVHGAELDLGAPALTVEQVEISSPTLRFVRDENGRTTLDALKESVDLDQDEPRQASPPFGVKVAQVEVKNGLVAVTDKGLGLEASVEGLRLDLSGFDLGKGRLGKLTLKGQGSHFDSLACAVSGGFSPLDLSGDMSLDGVDLTKPGPVLRRIFPNLVLAGKAQAKASFQVGDKSGSPTGKITVDLSANDLSLAGTGGDKPLVALRGLRLGGLETDLAGKSVDVGKVEIQGGSVRLVRDREGGFTLERLFVPASGGQRAAKADPGGASPQQGSGAASDQAAGHKASQTAATGAGQNSGATAETGQKSGAGATTATASGQKHSRPAKGASVSGQSAPAAAGRYVLRELAASGLTVDYQGDAGAKPAQVRFDSLRVRGAGFPLTAAVEFEAKGQAFGKGGFSFSGRADPVGLSGSLKADLTGLSLADAARLVPGLPVTVTSGALALSGELSAGLAGQTPSARYVGDFGLSGVSVTASGQTEPLVSLADLSAKGLDCAWPSAVVKARLVSLTAPALVLTLDQDGRPVLPGVASAKPGEANSAPAKPAPAKSASTKSAPTKSAAAKSASTKSASTKSAAAKKDSALPAKSKAQVQAKPQDHALLNLDLGEFSLKKGRVDVRFLGVTPPAHLDLSDLSVQAKPVKTGQPGQVSLSTAVGNAGRLSAEGQAGWVGGEPMLDLKAKLDNLDLTELSSVSRKFTGFPITRGKLGLSLDYKAGKKLFDLNNQVVVLGIQLGPKSRTPGGGDIPLDLAVSLLTDSNGVITMDIPVSGDTDNLKVDLSGVISKAMAGAFAKILFSPLAFLNVTRTDGRTAPVTFQPGTAQLTPEGAKTLTELAQALAQRPRLNLELSAYVDTAAEAGAFSVLLAEGHSAKDQGNLAPVKEKPGGDKAPKASAPPAQAQTVMPLPDDWRRLAASRLEAARRYLVDVAKLNESRVFTVSADPFNAPKIKGVSGARVDASLKY